MAGPWEDYQSTSSAGPWADYVDTPQEKPFIGRRNPREAMAKLPVADIAAGFMGGAHSYLPKGVTQDYENAAKDVMGANPESGAYKFGKLGGQVALTAGVGPALGIAAKTVGVAAPLVDAITTGGMTGGNMLTRMAGGAITGGATDLATGGNGLFGAGLGAAAPPSFKMAGTVGGWAGEKLFNLLTPAMQSKAVELAKATGKSIDEIVTALRAQEPSNIPGYQKTVPQILQDPTISQVQRTLKTAGNNVLGDAERVQQQQFRGALNDVAPIGNSVQDAADIAGHAIQSYAKPAEASAKGTVRRLFESVDPFNETAINLPIDAMKAAQGKYMPPGTFGTGSRAQAAINEAERIGTDVLPALKAAPVEKQQSLYDAVRSYGGINKTSLSSQQLAGEIRDLQAGAQRGAVMANNGHSVEKVASAMHERGFIPDNDPATLIAYLKDAGRDTFAMDANAAGMYARRAESAMGDLPGAETIAKPVPFQQVQSLRSSLNEAWKKASSKGDDKEAAALMGMIGAIDDKVKSVAAGKGGAGEYFPADIVQTWRDALKAHEAKKLMFNTGPQYQMFRQGADQQAALQGAEIPGKFFSGKRSQVEDVQSFKRLIGDNADLEKALKSYAMTEGAGTASQMGNLGQSFIDWVGSRSGANRELLTASELAKVNEVAKQVKNQITAENLGRVGGSDTAQKIKSMMSNGMLDNQGVALLAQKVPFGNWALSGLKNAGEKTRNNILSGLLSEPSLMAQQLIEYQRRAQPGAIRGLLENPDAQQFLFRTAPLLSTAAQ